MSSRFLSSDERYGIWQKALCLALSLFLAAPIMARETIAIQATSAQVRAADATIDQAKPNTNSAAAATLTVESTNRELKSARYCRIRSFQFAQRRDQAGFARDARDCRARSSGASTNIWGISAHVVFPRIGRDLEHTRCKSSLGCGGGDIGGTPTATATVRDDYELDASAV